MPDDYLLDTNIVIALFNGDAAVSEQIDAAQSVLLSSIVVGELYLGAFESQRAADNQARLEAFADAVVTLSCDLATAWHYGKIKRQLRQAGRPIPDNDMWIAATARQHTLDLVTRDSHFQGIEGLRVIRW